MKRLHAIALVLLVSAVPSAARAAGDPADFGGYDVVASGAAFSAFPEASGQVVESPAEATSSLSMATLSTGDQAFARASLLFPGDAVVSLEALLKFFGPAPDLPPYPVLAEAREFDDPQDASAPGATMHAEADRRRASATSESRFGSPDALAVGSARSISSSVMDGGILTATATTTVSDISLGGGVVEIAQVRTTSKSTTDGVAGTCSGGAEVSGVTIAGQEAIVDRDGVRASGEAIVPGVDADAQVREALAAAGITMVVIGGTPECGAGPGATHSASGLAVSMPAPDLGAVRATMHMVFGQASTSVVATSASTFEPGDFVPAGGGSADLDGAAGLDGSLVRVPGPASGGAPEPVRAPAGRSPVDAAEGSAETFGPVLAAGAGDLAPTYGGIPLTVVLGLFLAGVPGVRVLRRYTERLLAIGATS